MRCRAQTSANSPLSCGGTERRPERNSELSEEESHEQVSVEAIAGLIYLQPQHKGRHPCHPTTRSRKVCSGLFITGKSPARSPVAFSGRCWTFSGLRALDWTNLSRAIRQRP